MYTSFTDWESEYLEHFGTKGMKWGERRYQNPDGTLTALGKERYGNGNVRSRLGIKHDLNKLDREQTQARYRRDYYANKAQKKLAKLNRKQESDRKLIYEFRHLPAKDPYEKADNKDWVRLIRKTMDKRQKKIDKVNDTIVEKAKQYGALLERSQKMSERIISNAVNKGYSIHSRECLRSVNTGKNAVISALGTAAGMGLGMLTGVSVGVTTGTYASGNHYYVRDDGQGARVHHDRRRSRKA